MYIKSCNQYCDLRILSGLRRKLNNNSGIMLLVVLWMLVILSILAVSLGRNTNIELLLTKHAVAKAKAKYLAYAGIVYSSKLISEDSQDKDSYKIDTLYHRGIPISQESALEELFSKVSMDSGSFSVLLDSKSYPQESSEGQHYGFTDEDSKININAIDSKTLSVLRELIVLNDFEESVAKTISYSVADWVDANNKVIDDEYGAEDDYYSNLAMPYKCKNLPFDSKEELMLVRGMTKEIFEKIKDDITVFPRGMSFRVNFNTAPKNVLRALARSVTGGFTNADVSDADAAIESLINYRNGNDGLPVTEDDQLYDLRKIRLNEKERSILRSISRYSKSYSSYIEVNVVGIEGIRNVKSQIKAIISRADQSIVYWKRY